MEDIILKIQEYLPIILQGLGGLVVLATAIVKLTPSPKDDDVAKSISNKFFKFVGYLPTIGVNPRTKKLEEAYSELQSQNVSKVLDQAPK